MEQVLIFKLDGCGYAIDAKALIKIDRIPEITAMAYAPKAILGLCASEGQIIPVYDGCNLLNANQFVDRTLSEVRALHVRDGEKVIALLVESVEDNIETSAFEIELIKESEDAIIGFMKYKGGVVQILSLEKLLKGVSRRELPSTLKNSEVKTTSSIPQVTQISKQYLVFNMEDEKYGILIESVREIIVNNRPIVRLANAPKEVLGLITLREEVIAVIDLRCKFGKKSRFEDKNRILIVQVEASPIGLLVDDIDTITQIYDHEIETLFEKYKDEKVSGIAKTQGMLVTMLYQGYLKNIAGSIKAYLHKSDEIDGTLIRKRDYENFDEVLIFALSGEQYAVDVEDIIEIVRYEGSTAVPAAKSLIIGVINLRGEVIPVVSLHQKLGLDKPDCFEGTLLISEVLDSKVGFFVESVSDIVNIPLDVIKKNKDDENIFSHTILLDGGRRMVLKLAIQNLFLVEKTAPIEEEAL